jgi:hypothetical protein
MARLSTQPDGRIAAPLVFVGRVELGSKVLQRLRLS